MSEVTQDLLDDIFATVDAREAQADVAANSCDDESDDESDLDVPKALPQAQTSSFKPAGRGTPLQAINRRPLGPTAVNSPAARSRVNAAAGTGGRMVYQAAQAATDAHYFMVQWRKPQQKKHKTWDGDAFLKIEGSRITVISEEGKHMATGALIGGLPGSGSEMRIGGYECEVDRAVSYEEFRRQTSCLANPANAPVKQEPSPSLAPNCPQVARTQVGYAKPFKAPTAFKPPTISRPFSSPVIKTEPDENAAASSSTAAIAASSFYAKPKLPPKKIVIGEKNSKERAAWGGALHNPNAPGAVVLVRPPDDVAEKRKTTINDVVIDPIVSDKMREHQKEGVQFMYRCVMGLVPTNAQGCILADEMGLGKTLQTIALIYTLCKQSPFQNESSVISRALVVCPVSLVSNWKKEFRKWLPRDFGVLAIEDNDAGKISSFTHHKGLHVLIIGYERLRKVIKKLAMCQPPIGLIVCDEGHRLKSKDNKTTKMFDALSTSRRIILSGTPVQNDLGEYWSMADFACPGIFGTYPVFSRQYEKPILKARSQNCSSADAELGRERSEELFTLSNEFVIRRTAEVLDAYLPAKNEYVVFVAPTKLQLDIFTRILGGGKGSSLLGRGMGNAQLATIDLLRKVSNSPILLRKKDDDTTGEDDIASIRQDALTLVSRDTRDIDIDISGKLIVLDTIMKGVYRARDEKIVVVSNWTTTLDLIQALCVKRRYNFLRLDGSTPAKQRQDLVDQFNNRTVSDSMVFLLSAKAGGVGLNLIGARRLVLFDSDWNPSTDLQAMARIHRDGQKKEVFIYRLLTTNTIDEKIYQRQMTKTSLSDQMMAQGGTGKGKESSKDSFSYEELRDIFSINVHTDGCQTHDLLACDCGGHNKVRDDSEEVETREQTPVDSSDEELNLGFMSATQFDPEPTPKMLRKTERAQQAKLAALKEWRHLDAFNGQSFRDVHDNLLYNMMREAYKEEEDTSLGVNTGTSTGPSGASTPTDGMPPAKKRKGVFDFIDMAVEEAETEATSTIVVDSTDEEEEDDDEPLELPRRRKRSSGGSSKTTGTPVSADSRKKHNLRKIAEGGQAGRVMFVFEKQSKSRM